MLSPNHLSAPPPSGSAPRSPASSPPQCVVDIYIYIYMYIYIYIHTHVCVYIYIYVYIPGCVLFVLCSLLLFCVMCLLVLMLCPAKTSSHMSQWFPSFVFWRLPLLQETRSIFYMDRPSPLLPWFPNMFIYIYIYTSNMFIYPSFAFRWLPSCFYGRTKPSAESGERSTEPGEPST